MEVYFVEVPEEQGRRLVFYWEAQETKAYLEWPITKRNFPTMVHSSGLQEKPNISSYFGNGGENFRLRRHGHCRIKGLKYIATKTTY